MENAETTWDAVVVGAGLAGLVCARELVRGGAKPVVLEARERVGGRTFSQKLGKARVDLGGQWLGPGQRHALELAGELGLHTHAQYSSGLKILSLAGRVRTYRGRIPSLPMLSNLELAWVLRRLDRVRATIPTGEPWRAPQARRWDAISVGDWGRRHIRTCSARSLLDIAVRAILCAEPAEVSMLFFLWYLNAGGGLEALSTIEGGAQALRVAGGMQQLADRLAEELGDRVVLNAPVRAIEQADDSVVVRVENRAFHGRYAVVAVPPILADRIAVTPRLPTRRAELAKRMPMGSVIKYVVCYAEPFWRGAGYSGEAVLDRGSIGLVFDACSGDHTQPALVAFSDGDIARTLSELSADERRRRVLADLERLFGHRAAVPTHFAEKDWLADPWSAGCYTGLMAPAVLTTFGPALRQPCGRIHWAGTETASHWIGYIDGALESGKRAAAELRSRMAN